MLTNVPTLWSFTSVPVFVVDRGIQGQTLNTDQTDKEKFSRKNLFEAVASRDVGRLDGLHQHLHQNMAKLSDSYCERDAHNATHTPNG